MRRPSRIRNSPGVHGYVVAPALAWSGWRLRVPGGPEGGQYHGYTGDDSDHGVTTLSGPGDAWNPVWAGTPLLEGETVSDHVYRSPGEVRPRANANGGANVFREFQTKRSAGYAEAPGNYHALGAMISVADAVSRGLISDPCAGLVGLAADNCRSGLSQQTYFVPDPPSPTQGWPAGGTEPSPLPVAPSLPRAPICPQYMIECGPGYATRYGNDACQTPTCVPIQNTVAQPAPGAVNTPNMVPVYSVPPVSPSPAPTVAASPADYLPGQGQPLPPATPVVAGSTDIGAWLAASTIWSAVPNWALLAGGAVLLFSMKGKK